ncbi:MAG: plastocyanin/azurin family copper-binding protein [Pseudomonadota bacterium]
MNILTTLSATVCLVAGLAMPANAQNAEPDCPEDFDTLPGCDMSPMDDPDFPNNLRALRASREPATETMPEAAPSEATAEAAPQEPAEATAAPEPEETTETATTEAEPAAGHGAVAHGEAAATTEAATTEAATTEAAETEAAPAPEPAPEAVESAAEPRSSETHVVTARGIKFDPMFVFIQPGDTVAWENMPSHNIETIDEMVPEGQPKIETELGDNFFTTFETEGIVVYKCTPHWGARMGGILVVGSPENPGAILDAYMASTDVNRANLPARGLIKRLRQELEDRGML